MRPILPRVLAIALAVGIAQSAHAQQPDTKKDVSAGPIAPAAGEAAALALERALEREQQELLYRHGLVVVRITAYTQRNGTYVQALAVYRAGNGFYGKNRDDARAEVLNRLRAEAQWLQREYDAVQAEREQIRVRLAQVAADLRRIRGARSAASTQVAELAK